MKSGRGIKLYAGFYRLCLAVGNIVMTFGAILAVALSYAAGACRYAFDAVSELIESLFDRILQGRGKDRGGFSVARAIFTSFRKAGNVLAETAHTFRSQGVNEGVRKMGKDTASLLFALRRVFAPVFNVVIPVAAIVICVLVVRENNNFSYGIAVTFKGENIGVIEDESVFNKAVNSISARVENATGESYYIDVTPTYEIVTVTDLESFLSVAEMEERIIQNSPELFRESTGLYINDVLVAVTDFPAGVQNTLDLIIEEETERLKQEFGFENEDYTVEFTDTIELREGLYPITEKKTVAQITELLTSSVSEQVIYTIQSGDSLKGIAAKLEMDEEEIYALNPGIDEKTVIYPGDVLVIGDEVPFLQVQMSCTVTYEEETDIPVEYIETSSYYEGVEKIKREGAAGVNLVTAEVVYINGVEIQRIVTDTVVLKEAVVKQIYKGTKRGYTMSNIRGNYIAPVVGARLSSPYGYRTHPVTGEKESFHTGIDLAIKKGTPIYASRSGTITYMARNGNYGNLVKIDHGDGYMTYYAHCNNFASGLKVGDKVTVGDVIAYVGDTGRATGYHLHFELRYKGQHININNLFPEY